VNFQTSADLGATVQDQAAAFRLISNILKIVSLLMAAITIFTITYIDLVNKRRQVGIERAIGIKSSPIVFSYVLKAWAYALAGVGAGLVLFRYAITPVVASHPFHFPNGPVTLATTWNEMIRDLIILIIVASLAALGPAIRSVHPDPRRDLGSLAPVPTGACGRPVPTGCLGGRLLVPGWPGWRARRYPRAGSRGP